MGSGHYNSMINDVEKLKSYKSYVTLRSSSMYIVYLSTWNTSAPQNNWKHSMLYVSSLLNYLDIFLEQAAEYNISISIGVLIIPLNYPINIVLKHFSNLLDSNKSASV